MKKLDDIANAVYQNIEEDSIMVYYSADLNNIPSFMCSPFSDGWFSSKNTKDLVSYIFEIIIANYLLDSVMAFGDYDKIIEDDFDFKQSLKVYINNKTMNESRKVYIKKLEDLYFSNINQNLTYLEFVKLLIELEKCTPNVGIDLYFKSYSNPFEARHSDYLATEKFDLENLNSNF